VVDIRRICVDFQFNSILLGGLLIEAKELLPHGAFHDWALAEFSLQPRFCQQLMIMARVANEHGSDVATRLGVARCQLIAAKAAPPNVVQKIVLDVQMDRSPSLIEMRALLSSPSVLFTDAKVDKFTSPSSAEQIARLVTDLPITALIELSGFLGSASLAEVRGLGRALSQLTEEMEPTKD
jgi:hypothetical protein